MLLHMSFQSAKSLIFDPITANRGFNVTSKSFTVLLVLSAFLFFSIFFFILFFLAFLALLLLFRQVCVWIIYDQFTSFQFSSRWRTNICNATSIMTFKLRNTDKNMNNNPKHLLIYCLWRLVCRQADAGKCKSE